MGKSGSGGTTVYEHTRRLREALATGEIQIITYGSQPVSKEIDGKIIVDMQSREYPDFTQAVNKGAALLDSVDPEWFIHINTDNLNLDDENMCVLGQSWNHYKTLETAVLNSASLAPGTNFGRYLRSLFGNSKGLTTLKSGEAAEHGFAFSKPVYSWMNLEADRRVKAGELKSHDYSKTNPHASWRVDEELWEHLTRTWIVLIQARQEAYKRQNKLRLDREQSLIYQLQEAGVTNPPAAEIATKMVARGIYTVAGALASLADDNVTINNTFINSTSTDGI